MKNNTTVRIVDDLDDNLLDRYLQAEAAFVQQKKQKRHRLVVSAATACLAFLLVFTWLPSLGGKGEFSWQYDDTIPAFGEASEWGEFRTLLGISPCDVQTNISLFPAGPSFWVGMTEDPYRDFEWAGFVDEACVGEELGTITVTVFRRDYEGTIDDYQDSPYTEITASVYAVKEIRKDAAVVLRCLSDADGKISTERYYGYIHPQLPAAGFSDFGKALALSTYGDPSSRVTVAEPEREGNNYLTLLLKQEGKNKLLACLTKLDGQEKGLTVENAKEQIGSFCQRFRFTMRVRSFPGLTLSFLLLDNGKLLVSNQNHIRLFDIGTANANELINILKDYGTVPETPEDTLGVWGTESGNP